MQEYVTRLIQSLSAFMPGILGAVVLLLLAWLVSTIVRAVIRRVGRASKLDTRLRSTGLTEIVGQVCYWLVFLVFIPGILSALRMEAVLLPIQAMLNRLLGFLPNLIGATVILLVGWFVARLLSQICAGLLAAAGVDRLGERLGISGTRSLSRMLGLALYILTLIPVMTAALNSLELTYVTAPLSAMLNTLLLALPNFFAAAVLIGVSVVVGRVARELLRSLLAAIRFDTLPSILGLRTSGSVGGSSPSQTLGSLVFASIVLFASMEAARLLQFVFLATLINRLLVFGGEVLLGVVIFAFGLFLAQVAARGILATGSPHARLLATGARCAILFVVTAMALSEMGLARDIVNLAFGLMLGSIAVAGALAFGLGGRQAAAHVVERWDQSYVRRKAIVDGSLTDFPEVHALGD